MKVGDVVWHKAGRNYQMVIESIDGDRAVCTWITNEGDPRDGTFALVALELVPPIEHHEPEDDDYDPRRGRSRVTGY